MGGVTGLVVSEVFGPTVQGEGPSLGQRAAFVRLGGCNLDCSWCDTSWTWNGDRFDLRVELARRDELQIAEQVLEMGVPLAVITGGEPLLQQAYPAFAWLLFFLVGSGMAVEIETNGTLIPSAGVEPLARFNVGLKLSNSGVPERRRIVPEALAAFAGLAAQGRAVFKAVCRDGADVAELVELAAEHHIDPAWVWVMPEGVTPEQTTEHLRQIAPHAIDAGFRITPRLHVLAWGNERGH